MLGTSKRQIAITGVGVISPLGIGIEEFWANLSAGRSGITKVDLINDSALPDHIGGQARGFNDKKARELVRPKKSIKAMCREIQMGVASAMVALEVAGLGDGQTAVAPERLGIDFGANLMLSPPEVLARGALACCEEGAFQFHHEMWGKIGLSMMEPLWLLLFLPNMPACHIGISADARGPSNSLTMAEASGGLAISEAIRILERNSADVMICGTTGTTLHAVQSMHAVMWNELAPSLGGDPTKAVRPFDLNRTGQVVSEGAATIILEDLEHATARGAKLFGRILGAGSACVSKSQGVGNLRGALKLAMQNALRDAGLQPSDIGHVNAHAEGDPKDDVEEALAIHDVFGSLGLTIPVTALKSYWGNPGASCGTLELVGSLLAVDHGVVPQTLNYETPDPKCQLNVVHGEPLKISNKVFIKTSVTKAGQATAIVVAGE
ncbi:MAG: Beta-ketoacyl-acyl-carrier-protein synthase [Planctomycetaceae bacterium]|nr:Beta-ketoacyl-acyl-carrier-protein synthase [Planctomycetaceae bacterium]